MSPAMPLRSSTVRSFGVAVCHLGVAAATIAGIEAVLILDVPAFPVCRAVAGALLVAATVVVLTQRLVEADRAQRRVLGPPDCRCSWSCWRWRTTTSGPIRMPRLESSGWPASCAGNWMPPRPNSGGSFTA